MFFRSLSPAEETQFRSWARDNYKAGAEIKGIWHPAVQDECVRINRERTQFVEEPVQPPLGAQLAVSPCSNRSIASTASESVDFR